MNARTGLLRLAGAALLVGAMLAAGALRRSPWIVVFMAPVFTLLYALGKWAAWRTAWRLGGARQVVVSALLTLPIQAMLTGLLYLVGLGASTLLAAQDLTALSGTDALAAITVFVLNLCIALLIARREASAQGPAAPSPGPMALALDPTPLTLDSFFLSPHSRHAADVAAGKSDQANEAQIAATEARLGVVLPALLRQLYLRHDGGFVGDLYVPRTADPRPLHDDWRGAFSIDYSSLAPLEDLRSVADHYADFTDDEDEVPDEAARRIVLQARYGDMTLLDYSQGTIPRVLIVNYDKAGDPIDITFESFETFFAALRRCPR